MRFRIPRLPRARGARAQVAEGDRSYSPARERLRASNCVTPLRAGRETFPAMLSAIRAAQSHVHLEMYILRGDRIGTEFKLALVERAKFGVHVRLIYDSLGSFGLPAGYLAELLEAGVETVEFHPVAPWRARWGLNRRDHQKILVVDDHVGFTGGINIGDEYVPVEEGGGGWHDLDVSVEGPAVFDLARLFRSTWIKNGGAPFPEPAMPRIDPAAHAPSALVQVISNARLRTRFQMRRAYLHAVRRADRRISIMNAYFIPERRLRREFTRAARRGVDVRLIVPESVDVTAVYYATRYLYTRLLRGGVRIFEWQERMMHAKSAVIDGVWSTIGSYNLDRRSLLHNLEVGLIIIDRGTGETLDAQFEIDLSKCREVELSEWERRSAWHKLLEWCFFQFRYWL
jgi:cardiolipin synthase A/B